MLDIIKVDEAKSIMSNSGRISLSITNTNSTNNVSNTSETKAGIPDIEEVRKLTAEYHAKMEFAYNCITTKIMRAAERGCSEVSFLRLGATEQVHKAIQEELKALGYRVTYSDENRFRVSWEK